MGKTWEQAANDGDIICILDGARGIYLPQAFAQRFVVRESSLDDAMAICATSPDSEEYWDAWDEIVSNGTVDGGNGNIFSLWQDGDLFAINADTEITNL